MLEFLSTPESYLGYSDTEEPQDAEPSTPTFKIKNAIEEYSGDEESKPLLNTHTNGLQSLDNAVDKVKKDKESQSFFTMNSQQLLVVWISLQLAALAYVVCIGLNTLLESEPGVRHVYDELIDEEQRTFVNLQNFLHMYWADSNP